MEKRNALEKEVMIMYKAISQSASKWNNALEDSEEVSNLWQEKNDTLVLG